MLDKRVNINIRDLKYKQKNAERVIRSRRNNKMELIAYKGGKCEKCGYQKPYPSVYHFHHKNPKEKSFTLSRNMTKKIDTLKKEVDKCELLCSNCHMEFHDRIFEEHLESSINNIKNLSEKDLIIRAKRKIKSKTKKECGFCKNIFLPQNKEQKFCCVKCRLISNRKVLNRPSKMEIEEMLKVKSLSQIGKQYGITGNAVKKWIR